MSKATKGFLKTYNMQEIHTIQLKQEAFKIQDRTIPTSNVLSAFGRKEYMVSLSTFPTGGLKALRDSRNGNVSQPWQKIM